MPPRLLWIVGLALATGCSQRWEEPDPYDLDFEIPRTESFAPSLSAYGLFEAPMSALQPSSRAIRYDLSSELFTDYAHKQRLMMVPEGASVTLDGDRLTFPEGTVLVKTFYYPLDMRDRSAAHRVIETRLLVKTAGVWNVATYVWDEAQADATLLLDGTTTAVSWLDATGAPRSTDYAVPHEGQCVTCHQSDGASAFVGPTVQNLNRPVSRDGNTLNQLEYLHQQGVLESGDWGSLPALPDYTDEALALERRARAYLDINCAHCHQPGAWEESADQDVDFRFATPFRETGLEHKADELLELLEEGEMPYLGTTMLHAEGIELVSDYLESP